ncbi:FERM domain-containing protein [Aphelenchoides bicaudatus]|nr:FERM domain-containing protein [Aphelenchoides bicaudatus]
MDEQLNEGCICRVSLLNGELVEIILNKKHTVGDLLTYANKQCELPNQSWSNFGLAYVDENTSQILQQMPQFLDNKLSGYLPPTISLNFRFPNVLPPFPKLTCIILFDSFHVVLSMYPDAVTLLYLFYDARIQFLKGYLVQDSFDFVQCCAALIILCNGQLDLDTEEIADIFNDQIRPSINLLRNFDNNLDQIYVQVRDEIKRIRCKSQGNLILLFLKHAERSQTYGSAFYNVTDNQQRPLTLAINSRSIVVFESSNLYQIKKTLNFGNIDNILWKDCVFTVHARTQQRQFFK